MYICIHSLTSITFPFFGGREGGGYHNTGTYIIVVKGVQPTPNYPLKQSAWTNLNVNFVAHTILHTHIKIYHKSSMLGQKSSFHLLSIFYDVCPVFACNENLLFCCCFLF